MKTIGIIGIGWVGNTVKQWFVSRDHKVLCKDTNRALNYNDNIEDADVIFICVPTPSKEDGACDTSIVELVVSELSAYKGTIVIKSTVPPGTTKLLADKYSCVAMFNPEFLTEANAEKDFNKPDRQIIGITNPDDYEVAQKILSILPKAGCTMIVDAKAAEMAKYAANVFGAMKVVYSNVIYDYCAASGINYDDVKDVVGVDKRIGKSWMEIFQMDKNWRGYGGSCFPKDVKGFLKLTDNNDDKVLQAGHRFISAMREYNKTLKESCGIEEDA